MCDRYF